MKEYEEKLKRYMVDNKVKGRQLIFEASCHSVEEAAQASGTKPEDFVKNICMIDGYGSLIVAIVKGEDKASTKKIGKLLNIDPPRTAARDEILEKTGYPCGGVPSFGYKARFLIDSKVMEKDIVMTGGGSPNSLVSIPAAELIRVNGGEVVDIRK